MSYCSTSRSMFQESSCHPTSLLGALMVGGVLSNVVLLNLAFDVPGKLLSPHFAVMTALIILPDLKRVWDLHVTGEPVPSVALPHARTSPVLKVAAVLAFPVS